MAFRAPGPEQALRSAMPNLHFDQTERDLGQIPVSYQSREVRFPFVNRGSSDLIVSQLVTSCGCAAARVEPETVAPDEHGAVIVAIRSLEAEEKLAWVTLHTNDPRQPRATLEVQWRSVAPLEFQPLSVEFGQVLPETTTSRTVQVIRRELTEFSEEGQIQRIESHPEDAVRAMMSPTGEIEVSLTTGTRKGAAVGHLDVYLTGGWRESLRLPLRWEVRDVVEASPSELFVGSGAPKSVHERNVVITSAGDEDLLLESVSLQGDVNLSEVGWTQPSDHMAIVQLTCRYPETAGTWTSDLVVVSLRPQERVLTVPVSGYVVPMSGRPEEVTDADKTHDAK